VENLSETIENLRIYVPKITSKTEPKFGFDTYPRELAKSYQNVPGIFQNKEKEAEARRRRERAEEEKKNGKESLNSVERKKKK